MAVNLSLVTRGGHPDFLDLPWALPLAAWPEERCVEVARGVSRHVVRFVAYGERIYALKETTAELARREYRALRSLFDEGLPTVKAVGVATERTTADGQPLDAVLITRYLDYSLPYRYLFGLDRDDLRPRLIDAGALLLVRLHLEGVYWGDCSLSNVLFRRDAGALMAYLVDAETVERHDAPLPDGYRAHELMLAEENLAGGLWDLQEGGRLDPELDPMAVVAELVARYEDLWSALTQVDELDGSDRHLIDERVRHLNQMGFDVEELSVELTDGGGRLRMRPVLVEEGHHARELRRRTGIEVQENQARRLLNDIEAFRAWLERSQGQDVPEAIGAARWLAEVYEPLLAQVPAELTGRLEAPELFHELLEHRWRLSEEAGHEVSNDEALADYLATELPRRPPERTLLDEGSGDAPLSS